MPAPNSNSSRNDTAFFAAMFAFFATSAALGVYAGEIVLAVACHLSGIFGLVVACELTADEDDEP